MAHSNRSSACRRSLAPRVAKESGGGGEGLLHFSSFPPPGDASPLPSSLKSHFAAFAAASSSFAASLHFSPPSGQVCVCNNAVLMNARPLFPSKYLQYFQNGIFFGKVPFSITKQTSSCFCVGRYMAPWKKKCKPTPFPHTLTSEARLFMTLPPLPLFHIYIAVLFPPLCVGVRGEGASFWVGLLLFPPLVVVAGGRA